MLLAAAALVGILSNSTGTGARHGGAFWYSIAPGAFASAGCVAGAAIAPGFYALGPSFHGLSAGHKTVACLPSRGPHSVDGPRRPTGYVYITYGSCDFHQGPCRDPLEIQTWPECARNPNSYVPERGSTQQAQELNPHEGITVPSAPGLPAAEFEGETRIELYGGGVTVVVFSPDPAVGRRAASALAPAVLARAASKTPTHLRKEAEVRGDASTCTYLLPAGWRRRARSESQ